MFETAPRKKKQTKTTTTTKTGRFLSEANEQSVDQLTVTRLGGEVGVGVGVGVRVIGDRERERGGGSPKHSQLHYSIETDKDR